MPRFFFDVHEDKVLRDPEGSELADLDAAIQEAIRSLPAIAVNRIPCGQDRRSMSIVMRDGSQTALY